MNSASLTSIDGGVAELASLALVVVVVVGDLVVLSTGLESVELVVDSVFCLFFL